MIYASHHITPGSKTYTARSRRERVIASDCRLLQVSKAKASTPAKKASTAVPGTTPASSVARVSAP